MRRTSLRGAILAATLFVSLSAIGRSQPTDLFFSEYVEGTSFDKALEIFNGTGAAINLASPVQYSVQMFFNGSLTAGLTINLTGTVASGDVFVLAPTNATNATIVASADQFSGSAWFNGDDAVVLRKGTTVLDVIGQIGFDPGTEWGTGLTSTMDNTLRRKPSVCTGDANGGDAFAPSVEWDGFATNTFGGLGMHAACTLGGVGSANPNVVEPGGSTFLTVAVTLGSNPTSTGVTVVADLSSIGGSASQAFLDDGMNGDATSGDNIFSYQATVALGTPAGPKTLPVSIADAQARSASASIALALPAEIYAIQGSGAASPFAGQFVATRNNIVTARDTNGFFMQTPDNRADPSAETSNGIFVFTSVAPSVAVGDQVDVAGNVVEFLDLTEFSNSGLSVTVDSSTNPLPSTVLFDATTPSSIPESVHDLERFEGMLVRVENALANGPTDQFGDVPIVVGSSRIFREPGILFPGLPGLPVFDGNPEVFDFVPNGLTLPLANIPAGAVIEFAEGPLSFQFGDYSLLAKTFSFTGSAAVVPVRDRNTGEFTVGTQNLLRLFEDEPSLAGYADRLNKFSQLVRLALKSPDVLIVQEAENLTVLQDLAAKIADDSGLTYTPYLLEGNDIGGIDIGFLVRDTVQVDSVEQFGKDELFSLDGSKLNDRPPLVLRGSYVGGTVPFPIVVIGVHQRSLSGIEGTSTSANRVRQKRNEQAVKLSQYLQSLQEAEPDIRLTVAGDFNAFEFTDGYVDVMGQVTGNPDPAGALIPATDEVNPNLTNQTFNLPAAERYSFVFDGSAQSLDHALISSLLEGLVEAQHARGNSDAPFSFGADPSTSLRSSDHDGTVLFVLRDYDADGHLDDEDACVQSNRSATVVIDSCDSGAGNDLFSDGCKITDFIEACAAAAVTHEDFTGCVAHYTNTLKNNGSITSKEKGAIQKCAGKADIP